MKQPKLFHKMVYDKPVVKGKRHYKLIGISAILLIGLVSFVSIYVASKVNDFFTNNYLQFNDVLKMEWSYPVEVKKREMITPQVVEVILEYPNAIDTPIEKYICQKFGPYRCLLALAIFEAENKGLKEDAFHANTNGSVDVGLAQINSVNWKLKGCSLKEIVDPYKNVDCAYTIWDRADGVEGNNEGRFTPWAVYNSGVFKNNLK